MTRKSCCHSCETEALHQQAQFQTNEDNDEKVIHLTYLTKSAVVVSRCFFD